MGQLIAWHYRTSTFAKLADHTYVSCGKSGKAWACWGGKTGGTVLRQGVGSTNQADAIARQNERAGITCYLINGVCHQAANRILYPAKITVRGAKGYAISEALFGTYGRPRGLFGFCRAPFDKHSDKAGDLSECSEAVTAFSTFEKKVIEVAGSDQDEAYQGYLNRISDMYEQWPTGIKSLSISPDDTKQFQLILFDTMVDFKLGDTRKKENLLEIRSTAEVQRLELEEAFENKGVSVDRFTEASNDIAERFQAEAANALSEEEYQTLFELERGDFVVLGDPAIAQTWFATIS